MFLLVPTIMINLLIVLCLFKKVRGGYGYSDNNRLV